jgi:hypothetical protein
MTDGIRIEDAALEITAEGVEALVRREAPPLTVTRLSITVSAEALNTLIAGLAPEGKSAAVKVGEGYARVDGQSEGRTLSVELRVGAVVLQLQDGGVRLATQEPGADPPVSPE